MLIKKYKKLYFLFKVRTENNCLLPRHKEFTKFTGLKKKVKTKILHLLSQL